jgi:hypothetical protein
MTFSAPQPARFRDMFFAVIALVVAVIAFINLGAVIKLVGAGLMVIPSTLGIVQQARSQDVFALDLRTSPSTVGIGQPGRYTLYAYDSDLLTISDELDLAGAPPWITLESQVTGEKVPVTFVKRGLRPYDTPLAKGRPALSFVINQPGVYIMRHATKPSVVYIVRDYVTGREGLLTAAFLVQIGAVAMLVGMPFLRRYLTRRQARKQSQQDARRRSDAFWQRVERDPETWRRPK